MSKLAYKHKKEKPRLIENIENSYRYFEKNRERFHLTRNFVFNTSIDQNQKTVLMALQMPVLEFNILATYISRLCGEFSKSLPSIKVSSNDGNSIKIDGRHAPEELAVKTIDTVEGNLRSISKKAERDGTQMMTYKEALSGGYSGLKINTEYTGEISFHQDIMVTKVYDPSMCGWDPLAHKKDKSDGQYCFELVPMRLDDFKKRYPESELENIQFNGLATNAANLGPFTWSFTTGKDQVLLVADYYEKKLMKKTIVQLADGQTLTKEQHERFLLQWEMDGHFAVAPAVISERKTKITRIIRYTIIETGVIAKQETDFKRLPIIFVDGDSEYITDGIATNYMQMTKPYVMHAIGAQKLKNFAGQSLANELQNMGPAKIVAALEGLNDDYLEGYVNPQKAGTVIYNQFLDGDASKPINPPIMAPRPPIPQEISAAFMGADAIVQNVLGTFDASMSQRSDTEMSGIAYQEMATMSNAAALPYICNYLLAWESAMQLCVEMMPLYYTTERTIPVISGDGRHSYVPINGESQDDISFNFDPDVLKVSVEAGPSFSVQQAKALNQIISISRAIPSFGQFINESATDLVLDNVECRNVEEMRERSEVWMKQQQEMKAKAMEQAQQNPEQQMVQVAAQQVQMEGQVGMAKVQMQAASEAAKSALREKELALEQQKIQMETLKILADIKNTQAKLGIETQKADDDRVRKLVETSINVSEHKHDIHGREFDKALRSLEAVSNIKQQESKAMEGIAKGE